MRMIFTCLLFCCFGGMLAAQEDKIACGNIDRYSPPATKIAHPSTLPKTLHGRIPDSINKDHVQKTATAYCRSLP